jgi:hypothetical protein
MCQQVRIKRPENRQLYDRKYLVVDSLLKCTLVYTVTTQCSLISYKTWTLSSSWDHRDFFFLIFYTCPPFFVQFLPIVYSHLPFSSNRIFLSSLILILSLRLFLFVFPSSFLLNHHFVLSFRCCNLFICSFSVYFAPFFSLFY